MVDRGTEVPAYTVRPMALDDLGVVSEIDREAFETYRRQQRQLMQPMHPRTADNLRAAIQRPYPGVVIEWQHQVVGYCFTHVWGSLGWLGTLGVLPRYQGLGLGRAVTAAGLDVLRRAGCCVLALETMPESGKNLALYTRLGLEPGGLTMLCQGSPAPTPRTTFQVWSGGPALREVASRLVPGLDPSPAARWLLDEEAGETLVWWEDAAPAAFAVLRRESRRQESAQGYLTVEAAACIPEAAHHWPRYLGEMQTYSESLRRVGLVLPINGQQITLLRAALDMGMQIVHTRARLIDGPPLGDHDALVMLTLAM